MATSPYVVGSRPVHIHVVTRGDKTERIECNSPYCDDVTLDPAIHTPIIQGREPWRK